MTRKEILDAAAQIVTQDREDQYSPPEDCFAAIANLWVAYLQARNVDIDFLDDFKYAEFLMQSRNMK